MSDDRELKAIATVLDFMQPLELEERQRVLSWLTQKLSIEASPTRNVIRGHQGPTVASGVVSNLATQQILSRQLSALSQVRI
jgi:hypothetical protein